jgi:hypothetical protein
MKYSKWIGLLSALAVIAACYATWIYVPSVHLKIGGIFSDGRQNFGKPGLLNMFCSAGAIILFLLPRVWAKRTNIFFCGFNLAWAIRNYILLTRCYGGDCPEKEAGLYVLLFAAALMLLMAFVPDIKLKDENPEG